MDFGGMALDVGGGMGLGLQLDVPTSSTVEDGVEQSWVVRDDSMRHAKTGITIGEHGLQESFGSFSDVNPNDIHVDQMCLLGRGAGGVVARGEHKPSGTPLAIKVVRVEDKGKRSQLINELQQMLQISNPFLIQFYAAYVHKDTGCVHIALEYMDYGSLQDVKSKVTRVPENVLALIVMQILEGLKTLHLQFVVHRDVKLGNILVNSKGCVKVTDFGISKKLDTAAMCDTFVGTSMYMSPERVLGEDYSFAADIWGIGLCVYELASGTYPYGTVVSFPALFENLCNKPEPTLPAGKYSEALRDFVVRCLQRQASHRATAIQLQAHEFILSKLFQVSQQELMSWLREVMGPPMR